MHSATVILHFSGKKIKIHNYVAPAIYNLMKAVTYICTLRVYNFISIVSHLHDVFNFSPKPIKKIRELSIVSLSSTNIPPKEVECYTKAVQTTHSSNERDGMFKIIFLNFKFSIRLKLRNMCMII